MVSLPISDQVITAGTGRSWQEWIELLDAAGARNLSHKEIARLLADRGLLPDWRWCQGLTVGYERAIGRREVGQNCYGEYVSNATRTFPGTLDSGMARWLKLVEGVSELNGVPLVAAGRVSDSPKWRYWRADLSDGSKLNTNISQKDPSRVLLSVEHKNLADQAARVHWKAFWQEFLLAL